jgi:hypothetical protein
MLSKQNQAILLAVKTKAIKDKDVRYKTETFGTPVPKTQAQRKAEPITELERIALVDAGNGWTHVQYECVLLKTRKG